MKLNFAICAFAALMAAYAFIASNSAAGLALLLIVVAMPLISIVFGKIVVRNVDMEFHVQRACTVGQPLSLGVEVRRPAFYRGRIEMTLECHNITTGEVWRMPANLLPASGKVEHFDFPMDSQCCGTVSVKLASAREYDPFGFVHTTIPHVEFGAAYTVYPEIVDLSAQTAQAFRADSLGSDYDHARHGQDHTEVFDLREFRTGDSVKHVHWKLSARLDDLIVRVPSRPADCDIALVAGIAVGDASDQNHVEVLNSTLSMVASVSLSLLRQGVVHDVVHSEHQTLMFDTVDSRSAFDSMLDTLMANSYPATPQANVGLGLVDQWAHRRTVAKTVFITNYIDEAMFTGLAEITDLSVLYVGPHGGVGVAESGSYAISHIDAEAVGASVKNLEL